MKQTSDSLTADVLARAASYRDEVTDLTRRLVAIPTENPPGDGYAPCLAAIAETLDGVGLAPRRVEDCLLGWHGSGTPVVYLHGHYDVVPAQRREQFEPHLQLGRLYGQAWRPEDLQSIVAPTMVMIGDADVVRPEHAVQMFRLLPHAQLAVLPGTDHMTLVKRADWQVSMKGARLTMWPFMTIVWS